MSIRAWFRPPRHLIALFLLLTLVPSMLLVAFGWRLLQQDYELERRQMELRREEATDLVVSALEQAVKTTEESLRNQDALRSAAVTADSIAVTFEDTQLEAFPHGRLLYYPVAAPGFAAPDAAFARGDELEHLRQDAPRAAAWFQALARTAPPPIRAGALIGAARNLRKVGAHDAALIAYSDATRLSGTAIDEVPTELFARWARCGLLAELGRTGRLRTEALELRELLLDGRWIITRPVFEIHLQAASAWAGAGEPPASYRLALSAAADRLWSSVVVQPFRAAEQRPENRGEERGAGRRGTMTAGGVQFTVLSQTIGNRTAALIAGPTYAQREWKARIAALEERHHVRAELQDAGTRAAAPGISRRAAADTGLPWTVVVHDGQLSGSGLGGRRMMWMAGLAILACLVLTGSYVVGRAVSRELAVARLQSDFVAAVSHEFRTPLTSLRQLSEMLLERPDGPLDRRQTYYEALQRQTERLHRLVESLLDFGRMEAGTSPYRLQRVDVAVLVKEVVEQFRVDSAARGHRIELHLGDAGAIAADPEALTNALWNLLDNAVKYSPDSDTVRVEVERGDSHVAVHVRDHGFGIPKEEQQEIFRKFARGARAKAEHIKGTGIGLAMVQHIVVAHGGRVIIDSAPDTGTTFTVSLPLAVRPEPGGVPACLGS